jgi:hypothetical protein
MQERQFTNKSNIKARSRNHFYRKKAISITYSESVFVVLGTEHAKRMPVLLCHIFPHLIKDKTSAKDLLNIKYVF